MTQIIFFASQFSSLKIKEAMADEEKKTVPSGNSDNISPIERGDILEFQDVGKHADIGFDLFQQSHQYDPTQLERDAIKVRKKLDFIVLPMVRMTPHPQTNNPNIMKLRIATDDDDIHVKFSRQTDVRVFPIVTRTILDRFQIELFKCVWSSRRYAHDRR